VKAYDRLTTYSSPDFEWIAFLCEVCHLRVPIWQRVLDQRPDWRRRRFCSKCASKRFKTRLR